MAVLKTSRWRTGSQCRSRNTGVMRSTFRVLAIKRAAAFWTDMRILHRDNREGMSNKLYCPFKKIRKFGKLRKFLGYCKMWMTKFCKNLYLKNWPQHVSRHWIYGWIEGPLGQCTVQTSVHYWLIDWCFTARQHKMGQFVPIYQGDYWLRRLRIANEEHTKHTVACDTMNIHMQLFIIINTDLTWSS